MGSENRTHACGVAGIATFAREAGLAYASGGLSLLGRTGSILLRVGLFGREVYEGTTNAYAGTQALMDGKPLTAAYHYGLTVLNLFGMKNAKGALDDAAEMLAPVFKKPQMVRKSTEDLATRLEANAARQLSDIQAKAGPRSHFYSRHGAHTTLEQYDRALTGLTPDGFQGRPVDASRFLSHRAQLNAVQAAEEIFQRTGKNAFPFDMGYVIGEGFLKGGMDLVRTTNVQAVFDSHGKLRTLLPLLDTL